METIQTYVILCSLGTTFIISSLSIAFILSILPQSEKSKMASKFQKYWDELTTNVVKLSFFILLIVILFFGLISMFSTESWKEFTNGIHVELFGIIFDVLILVLLFNWFNSLGEKKREIKRHEDLIDDFRYWKSEEAKFRIIGSIKKLNGLGVTKMDLIFIDIGNPRIEDPQQFPLPDVKFNHSTFLNSDLSNLNMYNSEFNNITDHHSNFSFSNFLNAKFKDCHLQGTNFKNAALFNVDFSNSVLTDNVNFSNSEMRSVKFDNVKIDSANFEGAVVNGDFMEKVKEWNIKGRNVFLDYTVIEQKIREGVFLYHLIKIK